MKYTSTLKGYGSLLAGTALIASMALFSVSVYSKAARADTAPFVSSVSVSPSNNSAVVTWNTDQAATSQISYGTSLPYSVTTALNSSMGTTHSVTLTGLVPNTMYHFSVVSGSSGGSMASSSDQTFVTTGTSSGTGGVIATALATVTLSSSGGAAGAMVNVSGNGFNPYESISLSVGSVNVGTVSADASGRFSAAIIIPNSASGNAAVTAMGASSGRAASSSFMVGGTGSVIIGTTQEQMQAQIVQLQVQVVTLQQQVAALQANWQAYMSGSVSTGGTSGSSGSGSIPPGDTLYTGTASDVSAIGSGTFTLNASDGTTYTVTITSGATIWNTNRNTMSTANIAPGDSIRIDASSTGNGTLSADVVRDISK